MEPFPSPVDLPVQPEIPPVDPLRVQTVDDWAALERTRSGGAQDAISKLRRANTVAQGRNIFKRHLGLEATRDRPATTLRAKDSQELLRRGALQRSQTQRGIEARPPGRKAGHFTVGSVGQNGKIFLRPIANSSQIGSRIADPFSSAEPKGSGLLKPQGNGQLRGDPSRWSSSQLSELRPSARERAPEDTELAASDSVQRETSSQRRPANSFSTMPEKQSVSGAGKRGELRIVIDRTPDRPRSADKRSGHAALEVPIPHYRLGSPRFNTEGSAMLQSSSYTRTSMSDNFRNSTLLGGMAGPMPAHLPSACSWDSPSRGRPSFAVSMFSGAAAIDLSRDSPVPRNSMVYELKEPVEPTIYENLVSDMDDASVVRYLPGTKDISAATPARIVAQVSSESFMDYELVSDFFLTFRSYLSTTHLLALLLARLQWAINRLQDDGRIIRIRTFAALRHWILNYFVDDFVTDYDLRARFCETINALYHGVKSRESGGVSDLKILIDLKRCWNGKCSVYWTASDFSRAYNDPDGDIAPGSAVIDVSGGDGGQITERVPEAAPHADINNRESLPSSTQRDRNDSAATEESLPLSTKSDLSMLALSCSLPPKSPKRQSVPPSKDKAPRPVPLRTTTSASNEHPPLSPLFSRHPPYGHGHKRSGSFSDSVRDDRVPVFATEPGPTRSATQDAPDLVGLIRGAIYPPVESYMTMMAPASPPLDPPSASPNSDRRTTLDGASKSAPPSNPGVRTILGSIRRALHTRNGGQSVSARIANASEAITLPSRGKTSAMPPNVAFGSELYRERRMTVVSKRPTRIDLLSEEVLKQYRQAMDQEETKTHPHQRPASGLQITLQEPDSSAVDYTALQTPKADRSQTKSGLTAGSKSIVVVDDTGFDIPIMSGAGQDPTSIVEDSHVRPESGGATTTSNSIQADGQYLLPIHYHANAQEATAHQPSFLLSSSSRPSTPRRSLSVEREFMPRKKNAVSLRLRKCVSFQSGISRRRFSTSSEAGLSAVGSTAVRGPSEKPLGPALRRRPGGNLRKMGSGVDPGTPLSGRSSLSRVPFDRSVADRTAPTDDGASRPPTALVPPNPRFSLIQTNATRNLRRSFEAAIARFAQIPDDEDGGVASTLLKLEGKWDGPSNSANIGTGSGQPGDIQSSTGYPLAHPTRRARMARAGFDVRSQRRQTDRSAYSTVGGRLAPPRPYSDSVAESEESYNSIPLLERGLTDESMKRPSMGRTPHVDAHDARPPSLVSSRTTSDQTSSHPSIQIVQETDSIRRIPRGSTVPASTPRDSDYQPRVSALSSELSADMIDSREAVGDRRSTDTGSLTASTVDIPPHPLAHPPSPPMTIQHPTSMISCSSPFNPVLFQSKPLTPETSPRHGEGDRTNSRPFNVQQVSSDVLLNSEQHRHDQHPVKDVGTEHVPFVLACESQVLAQQLTLVEMAALSEVDWRDLVEMKWGSGSPGILNWVQFLRTESHNGIELVVGRFNLMVNWVLSEIVLTRDIHERARTITKYIHTAAHARRICNYATMLQIAIALSSSDCARLQRTWQLVPAEDRRLFKDMECLIQPVRNFHDLRVEMETANLQEGCIPFIGLYVHDLTYNAQKPAQISNTDGGLLVNFERYRTSARIVKSLLRLIDASTKYRFDPVPGIIERCLWIATLPDDAIQARSRQLE